jgi:hypothetical protein
MIVGLVLTAAVHAPSVVSFLAKGSNLSHEGFLMTEHSASALI